jgi:hypothetical protein
LLQVSAQLPCTREGRPVHPQTIRNWIVVGRKGPAGQVIKLRGRRFPGGWRVKPEDLDGFLDELTAACMKIDDPSGPAAPDPAAAGGVADPASKSKAKARQARRARAAAR